MMNRFGETRHLTAKSKGGGKLSIHFCADGDTTETVFRRIISVNQLSVYTAVSDLCDEYRACQARKVRPVLAGREVTTSCLHGTHGVEIRIESVNTDNSHSWVRISHGLNKLVTDLIDKEYDDNEQETSDMKSEEFALKTNEYAFASRSKAKTKPRRRTSACSSTRTVPICERSWTDVEPGTYRLPSIKTTEYSSSSW